MAVTFDRRINIQGRDSFVVLPLDDHGPGTQNIKIDFQGNSLLSTLFVEASNGATIDVNYFDFTVGFDVMERFDLEGHVTPGDLGNNRILVTQLHNKAVAEVIVTGGTARFGIYATIVDFSASDIDASLVREGQTSNFALDKGLITAFYNPSTGTYQFGRIDNDGNICVKTSAPSFTGADIKHFSANSSSTPGTAQDLITEVVPASTTRFLRKVIVSHRHSGNFTILRGVSIIGSGKTGPSSMNVPFSFGDTPFAVAAGETVKVRFEACSFSPADSVDAYLMATDET